MRWCLALRLEGYGLLRHCYTMKTRQHIAVEQGHPEWASLPTSAKEANALKQAGWPDGLPKQFFTGQPCKHGHVAPRALANGGCLACLRVFGREYDRRPEIVVKLRQWQRENREHLNAYMREYRKREHVRAYEKAYQQRPDVKAKQRDYDRKRLQNPEVREAQKQYLRERYRRPEVKAQHREYMRPKAAERDAQKLRAMPPWLTDAHKAEIEAIYAEAVRLTRETGIPHEVDHIVPLKGRHPRTGEHIVCGLHVPWNLRVVPWYDNRAKWCIFDPDIELDCRRSGDPIDR